MTRPRQRKAKRRRLSPARQPKARTGQTSAAGGPTDQSPPATPSPQLGEAIPVSEPRFGESARSPDPTRFVDQKSDLAYYKLVNRRQLQPIPAPRDPTKFTLTLEEALGGQGHAKVQKITSASRIVFHAVGDTGPTKGPETVTLVADKMVEDFNEADPRDVPQFFYHLGDVIYSFGEDEYYYDQFYEPFREYQAPIFAIPGNHDGVTYKGDPEASLAAFLRNFCSETWKKLPEAGTLSRTAMIQPGVYFTLEAPFVKIIGLYSNVLEDPGVISSEGDKASPVTDDQLTFLTSQLQQLAKQKYKGALLIAVHHPPFSAGTLHGGSPRMLADLDRAFQSANFYPHAVLSGHAHNYQRYTRKEGGRQTPFIVAGCGGHGLAPLQRGRNASPIRTPLNSGNVQLESYASQYGYLRVVVTDSLLSIEFHEAAPGAASKSPTDVITIDLATRMLTGTRP